MKSHIFKQLVWDYNLNQKEFEAILQGKKVLGNMNQSWAIARVLENLNYYDAMSLISLDTLRNNWNKVKGRLFNNSIKNGYEFLLQRYPVSITG
ncbi:MAG: hypothetical protein AAB569_06400 [Patescibacteria group bacterium]